ncbi:MAG: glycerophosphoryl diester phosphodiesterase membrane domain-containing protein, partial [Vallitaleaceae bacterium]|nr:glycerophosphoryl diester phosphodiesterase membrane domain-containing protein [Vallitaleaceae bacterium]
MKVLRYNFRMIMHNYKAVFWFEVLYRLFVMVIFSPLLKYFIRLSIRWSKISYLNLRNIPKYLASPLTLSMLLFLLILLTILSTIEIASIIFCFDAGRRREDVSVIDIFLAGFKKMMQLMKPKNWISLFPSMLFIPISFLHTFVSLLNSLNLIPLLIILPFSLLYGFVFHEILLDGKGLKSGMQITSHFVWKNHIKLLRCILLWLVMISVGIAFIYLFFMGSLALVIRFTQTRGEMVASFLNHFRVMNGVLSFWISCIEVPLILSILSALFFYLHDLENRPMEWVDYHFFHKDYRKIINKRVLPVLLMITVAANLIYIFSGIERNFVQNIELLKTTEISAHRGSSAEAPENTLAALRLAIEQTADYIEIDVHQTADGRVVLLHDTNLRRTTGWNRLIYQVNYEDLLILDAGAWFSPEYIGEKIPTLEEAIEEVKGKAKLNIEIKPSRYERNLVEEVVRIISDYELEDSCVITSFDYNTLRKVKSLNPEIQTGLISHTLVSNFYAIPYIDLVSLSHTKITAKQVESIHMQGKRVFAWTVNNRKT